MPKLGLVLNAPIEGGIQQQVDDNFTRLENVFATVLDVATGLVNVTGSVSVNTGLSTVTGVMAQVVGGLAAGACFVVPVVGGAGLITINVYSNVFVASVIPCSVQWVALGELVLT